MNEGMRFIGWCMANAALWATTWSLAHRAFGSSVRSSDSGACGTATNLDCDVWPVMVMHAIVAAWSVLVLVSTGLGLLHALKPWTLLAGVGSAALVMFLVIRISRRPAKSSRAPSAGAAGVPDMATQDEGLPSLTLGAGVDSDDGQDRPSETERTWGRFRTVAWTLLAAVGGAHVVWNGVLTLPTDWDTLAYHLPLVGHWLREGSLYVPDCAFWFFPGNNELWALWFVAPFSGDYLVALTNVPATFLWAVSVVALGSCLGLRPALVHPSAMALLVTVPVWRQLLSAENDVAVAALFTAGLVYGVRFAHHGRRADLIWMSLSLGLLVGIKYYALGYAVAALAGAASLTFSSRGWRPAWAVIGTGSVATGLLGSYWYARNAWATGSPVFPLGLTAENNVWGAMRPDSHTSTLMWCGRWEVWPMLWEALSAMAGPFVLAAVQLLPLTVLWLLVSGRFRSRADEPAIRAVPRAWLALMIVVSSAVFLVTPNAVETVPGTMNMLALKYHPVRFALAFLSLAGLGLATVLDDVARALLRTGRTGAAVAEHERPPRASRLFWQCTAAAVSCLVLAGAIYHGVEAGRLHVRLDLLLLAVVGAEVAALLYFLGTAQSKYVRRLPWVSAVGAVFVLAWACQVRAERWHAEFWNGYDTHFNTSIFANAVRWDPRKERICVFEYRYYPFLGSHREFDVCQPLWTPEYPAFLRCLQKNRATIVVTRNRDVAGLERYRHVVDWITSQEQIFSLLHQDSRYTAMRVRPAGLAQVLAAGSDPGEPKP